MEKDVDPLKVQSKMAFILKQSKNMLVCHASNQEEVSADILWAGQNSVN